MSHCQYCRRELPGLVTLCDSCYGAAYDRVVHPETWWLRRKFWHRPRLTRRVVYVFLLFFAFAVLRGRAGFAWGTFDGRLTITNSDRVALVVALVVAFVESTRKDPSRDSKK